MSMCDSLPLGLNARMVKKKSPVDLSYWHRGSLMNSVGKLGSA